MKEIITIGFYIFWLLIGMYIFIGTIHIVNKEEREMKRLEKYKEITEEQAEAMMIAIIIGLAIMFTSSYNLLTYAKDL